MRIVFLLAGVVPLTGCGGVPNISSSVNARWYDPPDGRQVLCIFEKRGYGGGLSCDWENARAAR